ncbi:MAG: GYD domain-containing protein [Geminicoccaceae bacterium]|nr:GYD domain-containing protein [Geminicoccaceae bacterium]MCS7267321.1 GYD domain-containing protein [Geminicoccaceae bacterium]MCX7630955.1 GYD domain-containing protein [Geminicoccaceae bacterium]MDW8125086.1 GYD domain-containing protein [Geminicoccaceae bacterium]MDW8340626.1 GYD domain-containing protein [Geminicoccaceae bacterium]
MTLFVALVNWTDQGIRSVQRSPERFDAAKAMLEEMGGRILHLFMTMGPYDLVVVYETPDDAVAARWTLQVVSQGNVRTLTMKAYPEAAYREIIASLG